MVGTDEVVEYAHPEGVKMATGSNGASRSTVPQRRYLTILFCDLVGYTELSERLDPEDLRDLQLQYQRLALTVMERYGGFVAQFSGDGVLVYFGYPAAHENDAERAVRAALELNDRLHELNAELGGQQLPEIAIRIGIHTGLIVIGSELASGGAQDHSIVGEAANLAARLQADAPTNSVIVSGETFEMISGMFDYEFAWAQAIQRHQSQHPDLQNHQTSRRDWANIPSRSPGHTAFCRSRGISRAPGCLLEQRKRKIPMRNHSYHGRGGCRQDKACDRDCDASRVCRCERAANPLP